MTAQHTNPSDTHLNVSGKPLKIGVVVVAAGRGSRASDYSSGPKQYFKLGSQTLLERTLRALLAGIEGVEASLLTVIHADDGDLYEAAIPAELRAAICSPTHGGGTRQASVLSGLEALAETKPDVVLVHDAARPFVSPKIVASLIERAAAGYASLPLLPVHDTVKRVKSGVVEETIDRSRLGLAQTPQAFPFEHILDLHRKAASLDHEFTDDIAIAEHFGVPIHAVAGDPNNIKLTTPEDMRKAQAMLAPTLPDIR
ncbi:MAG: 2-C-methyl-D-erythritol 4-phosphate cytidylyltransferase, partial [Pseudomonadota bacterium]